MTTHTSTNQPNQFDEIRQNIIEEYLSETQNYPWIITFSGGKDSTLMAHLVFECVLELPPHLRKRPIYFVSNDTLVESPPIVQHMRDSLDKILNASKIFNLPITGEIIQPIKQDTFWVTLIGKGYPSPNRSFRWCTDRLKIKPTSNYIKQKIDENGHAIIVLGVRKDESSNRKASIERHQNAENSNLTPHNALSNAWVYRPIMDVMTDDVWEFLSTFEPPWGGSHDNLIRLYREGSGGECPIVFTADEKKEKSACGSRFGCWTCTVVDEDKSLKGFIKIGKLIETENDVQPNQEFQPLVEFRDWLKAIRNNEQYRSVKRRNGKVEFNKKNGKHIPGAFTIQARKEILQRLLDTQKQVHQIQIQAGESNPNNLLTLISEQEIEQIKQQWSIDLIDEMEQD